MPAIANDFAYGSLRYAVGLGVLLFMNTGCATLLPSSQHGTPTEVTRSCEPSSAKSPRLFLNPSGFSTSSAPDDLSPQVAVHFTQDAIRTADTIGALPSLIQLVELHDKSDSSLLKILVRRQQLYDQTTLAILEIESTTAEIICERDRADQLADRIDEVDGAMVRQLTIGSIVIGGVAGIVTGIVGLAGAASTAADASSVGGGALSAWLGVSALFAHSEVNLQHERNILKEVWEDPGQPKIISPILWRYLHRSDNDDATTPRTELLNAWRQKGRLGEPDSKDEQERRALFFGTGGRYAAPELRARASMLETLEATLRLLHEELEVLVRQAAAFALQQNQLLEGI
jgi:hypothetical protein